MAFFEKALPPLLKESLEIKSMKLGLERMEAADQALGFPTRKFESIQVAGTNGKGSVSTKLAKVLQIHGKKVGLYTSPHIHTYHERIQINQRPIEEERADLLLKKILSLIEIKPSYFELLTLLAFCYFAEENVDLAILETGMGGRLDATNIVMPLLSVITSIEKDHTQYLGESYEAIAYEKAGIIKPGRPVLLGPNAKPLHVFEQRAKQTASPLFQAEGTFSHYEEENQAIAKKALSLLPILLAEDSIACGLTAIPPCRFEIISQNPVIILDVAHNPDGLKRTFERIFYTFPDKKVRVVAGFSADKAIQECLSVIKQNAIDTYLTHTNHARLSPLGEPLDAVLEKAYMHAKKKGEILLICGTFFIMHQARILSTQVMQIEAGLSSSGGKPAT